MDAAEAATKLAGRAKALCRDLFPNGAIISGEYRVGNINGDKGQSLSVCLDGNKQGIWFDFDSTERGDALDLVKAVKRLDTSAAITWAADWLGEPASGHNGSTTLLINGQPISVGGKSNGTARPVVASPAVVAEPENNNREHALNLWNAASKAGPIAATYLRSRGISIAAPGSIREMAALKHGPSGQTMPCLIAAVQGPDEKIIAVHRTYLSADFSAKAAVNPQKMALGSIKGGKVRLAKAAPTLAVCEGIETGLSIQERYRLPTWCALGASNLPNMMLPAEVRRVVICADNGAAGIREADKAAARFEAEGRDVLIAQPTGEISDFNDLTGQ